MSQDGAGTEVVDGAVAVVAAMSAKKSHRHPSSPAVVVVPAVPEYRVRSEQEDGVALLTDGEPPATRDEHVDIFAPSQLLTRSFEEQPIEGAFGQVLLRFVVSLTV